MKKCILILSFVVSLFGARAAHAQVSELFIIDQAGNVMAIEGTQFATWAELIESGATIMPEQVVTLGNISTLTAVESGGAVTVGGSTGYVTIALTGAAYTVIAAELVILGYETYQLVDATIDWSNASSANQQLQQQLQAVQAQIAAQYPSSCCCLRAGGSPTDPGAWWNAGTDEWSCRNDPVSRGTPAFCYDGFPQRPAVLATLPPEFQDPATTLGSRCAYMAGYRGVPVARACAAPDPLDCLPAE
jgi:hypothetical protein